MLLNESKFSRKSKIVLLLSVMAVLALTTMVVWATVPDFDNDGLLDNEEILYGTFGYGLANNDSLKSEGMPAVVVSGKAYSAVNKSLDAHWLDDWMDTDNDGIPDPYDTDVDGDLVSDFDEVNLRSQVLMTDLLPNEYSKNWDQLQYTDPGIDGRINPYFQTDPTSFDSDGDGRIEGLTVGVGSSLNHPGLQAWFDQMYNYSSGCDLSRNFGRDTLASNSQQQRPRLYVGEALNWDSDNDGLVDAQDIDSDNDGIPDTYIDVNKDGDYDRGVDVPGEDIPNIDVDDDDCDEIDLGECYGCATGSDTKSAGVNMSDTDYEEDLKTSICDDPRTTTHEICNDGEGWEFSDGVWDVDGMDNAFANASGTAWDDVFDNETNSLNADSDFDGLGDKWEIAWSTNPNDADTDDDGLVDGWVNWNALIETYENHGILVFNKDELPGEYILGTDPLNRDTDGDGLSDGVEVGLTGGQMGAFTIGGMPGDNGVPVNATTYYPAGRQLFYPRQGSTIKHHGAGTNGEMQSATFTIAIQATDSVGVNRTRDLYIYDQCANTTTDPLNKDSDYDGLPDGWINGWGNYFWRDDYYHTNAVPNDVDIDLGEGEDINANGCWEGPGNRASNGVRPDKNDAAWLGNGFTAAGGVGLTFYEAYSARSDNKDGSADSGDALDVTDFTMDQNDEWSELDPDKGFLTAAGVPVYETSAYLMDSDFDGLTDGEEIMTDRWLGNDDYDGDINPDRNRLNSDTEGNVRIAHLDWDSEFRVEDMAWQPASGDCDKINDNECGNHDVEYNWSYSVKSGRPGAGGGPLTVDGIVNPKLFKSSMRDRTDPVKWDSDEDGMGDGREVKRADPVKCSFNNSVVYGYTTSPLFKNSDGLPTGNYDNEFEGVRAEWETDEDNQGFLNGGRNALKGNSIDWKGSQVGGENGYTRTWLGAPYLWWVADLRDENWDNTDCMDATTANGVGDCTDYPIASMGFFRNDSLRYRTDVDGVDYGTGPDDMNAVARNDMIGNILGFYDYQFDSDNPRWFQWRPNHPYESPLHDADLDGMVDALDPNTFYNDDDQDGLPNLFEDPDADGIDRPCKIGTVAQPGVRTLTNGQCVDADYIWMPGETWWETSKWDGDTDDDGLWDGDEVFPDRIALDEIPNYNLYFSDPLDRDSDDDGVVDGYNNGGARVFDIITNEYVCTQDYGKYNPWDPRTFNDGAWPGNRNVKSWVCRWHFNTGRNTDTGAIVGPEYPEWDGRNELKDFDLLRANFYNEFPDIPGELVATIDYYWSECNYPVWDAGQIPFLPNNSFFKAYYTATDPLNPDTDGDRYSDGWMPAVNYNASYSMNGVSLKQRFLLNHDSNESWFLNNVQYNSYYASDLYHEGLPHFYYPKSWGWYTCASGQTQVSDVAHPDWFVCEDAGGRVYPPVRPADNTLPTYMSGNKELIGSQWLLSTAMAPGIHKNFAKAGGSYPEVLDPGDFAIVEFGGVANTNFCERYYQPPVDWGFFRVTYYKLEHAHQQIFTDRFYEYMLYDEHGISRLVRPWEDLFDPEGHVFRDPHLFDGSPKYHFNARFNSPLPPPFTDGVQDNDAGQVLAGWGRPDDLSTAPNDHEGTEYNNGNNDAWTDFQINALDRDSDDDHVYDWAERRGEPFPDESGNLLTLPRHPSNAGTNNSDFNVPGDNAADDYMEYLANNSHTMRSWDDESALPVLRDEDADGIMNAMESAAGTRVDDDDTDGDGLHDLLEMHDFIWRAPGDPGNPYGIAGNHNMGDFTGLGTDPTDMDGDSDNDGVSDLIEWGGGFNANAFSRANDPNFGSICVDNGKFDYFGNRTCDYVPHVHPYLHYAITFTVSNPLVPDTDNDGLQDNAEFATNTEPRNADTDGDDLLDGNLFASTTDAFPDRFDDTDVDGMSNWQEQMWYTDPNNKDTDFDGLWDGFELNTDRTPDTFMGGAVSFDNSLGGVGTRYNRGHRTEPTLWDTDGDGIPDGWTNKDWLGYDMNYWTGEDRNKNGFITGDNVGPTSTSFSGYRILEPGETWTETDPLSRDSDGQYDSHSKTTYLVDEFGYKDGLVDGYEENPNLRGADAATDINGLSQPFENWLQETNPLSLDSDWDYLVDNMEIGLGTFSPYVNMMFTRRAFDYGDWSASYDDGRNGTAAEWVVGGNANYLFNDADRDDDGILDGHEYYEAKVSWTFGEFRGSFPLGLTPKMTQGNCNLAPAEFYSDRFLPIEAADDPNIDETVPNEDYRFGHSFLVLPRNSDFGDIEFDDFHNSYSRSNKASAIHQIEVGTNPVDWDTDKDGLFDGLEIGLGTSQGNAVAYTQIGDYNVGLGTGVYGSGTATLPNWTVFDLHTATQTDPLDSDTDNDFLPDGWGDWDGDAAQYPGWLTDDLDDALPTHPTNGRYEHAGEDGYYIKLTGINHMEYSEPIADDYDGWIRGDAGGAGTGAGFWDSGEMFQSTDPADADTDDDGLMDGFEDSDADRHFGLADQHNVTGSANANYGVAYRPHHADEYSIGHYYETNPLMPSTDHDGLGDGMEAAYRYSGFDYDNVAGKMAAWTNNDFQRLDRGFYGASKQFGISGPMGVYEHWNYAVMGTSKFDDYNDVNLLNLDLEGYNSHSGHWDAEDPRNGSEGYWWDYSGPVAVRRDMDPYVSDNGDDNAYGSGENDKTPDADGYDYDTVNKIGVKQAGWLDDANGPYPCDTGEDCVSQLLHYKGSYHRKWVEDADWSNYTFSLIDDSDEDGLFDGGYLVHSGLHTANNSLGEDFKPIWGKSDVFGDALYGDGSRSLVRKPWSQYPYKVKYWISPKDSDPTNNPYNQMSGWAGLGGSTGAETDPTTCYAYATSPRVWFGIGFDGWSRRQNNVFNPFGIVGANTTDADLIQRSAPTITYPDADHRHIRFNPRAARVGYDTDGGDNGSSYFNNLTWDAFLSRKSDDIGGTNPGRTGTSQADNDFLGNSLSGTTWNVPSTGYVSELAGDTWTTVDYFAFYIDSRDLETVDEYKGKSMASADRIDIARPMQTLWTNDGTEINANSDPTNPWGTTSRQWADQDIDIVDFTSRRDNRHNINYQNGVMEDSDMFTAGSTNINETEDRWLLDVGDDHVFNHFNNLRPERMSEMILDDDNNINYTPTIYWNIEGEYDVTLPEPDGSVQNGRTLFPGDISELGKYRTYYTDWNSDPNGNNVLYGQGDYSYLSRGSVYTPFLDTYGNPLNFYPWYQFGFYNDGFTSSYVPGPADVRYQATGLRWITPLPGTQADYGPYMLSKVGINCADAGVDEVDFNNIRIGRPTLDVGGVAKVVECGDDETSNTLNDYLTVYPNDIMQPGEKVNAIAGGVDCVTSDATTPDAIRLYKDNFVQAGPFPPNKPTSADDARDWHGGAYTGEFYAIEADGFAYDNYALTFHVKEFLPDLDIDNDDEGNMSNNIMRFDFQNENNQESDLNRSYVHEIVIGVPNSEDMNVDFDSYDGPATVGVYDVSVFDPDSAYAIYSRPQYSGTPWNADALVYSNAWFPINETVSTTKAKIRLYNYDYLRAMTDTLWNTVPYINAWVLGQMDIRPGDGRSRIYVVKLDSLEVRNAPKGLYMPFNMHSPFGDAGSVYCEEFEFSRYHEPTGNVYIVAKGDDESGPMMFNPYEPITELCIDWFRLEVNIGWPVYEVEYGPVMVTNLSSSSATVSWTAAALEFIDNTDKDVCTFGRVDYGTNGQLVTTKDDDRGVTYCGYTHQVTLTNLAPNTTYTFQAVSGWNAENNDGQFHTFTTLPERDPGNQPPNVMNPTWVVGCIEDKTGVPVKNQDVLVYIFTPSEYAVYKDRLGNDVTNPYDISTHTDSNGLFILDIANRGFGMLDGTLEDDYVIVYVDGGLRGVGMTMVKYADIMNSGANPYDISQGVSNNCIALNGRAVELTSHSGFSMWTPPGQSFDQKMTANFFLPYDPTGAQATGGFGAMEPQLDGGIPASNIFYWLEKGSSFSWHNHSGGVGESFAIDPGVGYMYYNGTGASAILPFTGIQDFTTGPTASLISGYNAVGFPTFVNASAYDLITNGECAISSVRQILKFDKGLQAWRSAFYYAPISAPLGPDFTINNEEGYVVVAGGSSSTPRDCMPSSGLIAGSNDESSATRPDRETLTMGEAMSEVYVTDVTSASAALTWFTDGIGTTVVRYGTTTDMKQQAVVQDLNNIHHVVLSGLEANATYYYQAISNGKLAEVQTFTTTRHGYGLPQLVHGMIETEGKVMPNALIIAQVEHGGFISQPISAVSDQNGHYLLNLGNLKTNAGYAMNYSENDNIVIRARGGFGYAVAEQVVQIEKTTAQDLNAISLMKDNGSGAASSPIITTYGLRQNYPNPFNPSTAIRYQIPKTGRVSVRIYNSAGQLVKTLVDATQQPNHYEVVWDGKNDNGEAVVSGVYFYRLESGDFGQTNKMVMLK